MRHVEEKTCYEMQEKLTNLQYTCQTTNSCIFMHVTYVFHDMGHGSNQTPGINKPQYHFRNIATLIIMLIVS